MNAMRDSVLKAVDVIEASDQYLSLDDIAGKVYLSKYHLNRIFSALTGKGLIEYARSRHLAKSLYDLLHSEQRIGEIALRLGYEHESSYTRAFQREFGLSPQEYRRRRPEVRIVGRITPSSIQSADNGLILTPFTVHRPAFMLGGLRVRMSVDDSYYNRAAVKMAADFFYHHSMRIQHPVDPLVYYGFSWWDEYHAGYSEYMSALQIEEGSIIPSDMTRVVIPTGDYAVFRYVGTHHPTQLTSQLGDIWSFIEYTWLAERGITRQAICSFEYVDMKLARDDYCELDLYVRIPEEETT